MIAIGLAVPCIEAWYLAGKNSRVGEAEWSRGLASGRRPYTNNELKQAAYGTDRPGLQLETLLAIEEATRLVADLSVIEKKFPVGFGHFAQTIRQWLQH